MIIMALDHVRDFFSSAAMAFSPENLTKATTTLFLTRWVTHFCAPVFMFTAGLGAFFWLQRPGRTKAQLSRFLWTRGLWLVFLDLVVSRLGMDFSLTDGPLILNVLWALGWSMVILAALVHLPIKALATLSVAVIALHNLMDSVSAAKFGSLAPLWNILHQPGAFALGNVMVLVAYAWIPWFAVMAAGFCFGAIFTADHRVRQRWCIWIGCAMIAAFLVLRWINAYGDPQPWSPLPGGRTVLSFLRCTKYPPSLDFLLMTLGPSLVVLAWFDGLRFNQFNPLIVFGRVPLFYFLGHFYLAHLLAIPLALLRYGSAGFIFSPAPSMGGAANIYPANYGYSLGTVYGLWLLVVVLMYPVCRWFMQVKQRRRDWWLSYL